MQELRQFYRFNKNTTFTVQEASDAHVLLKDGELYIGETYKKIYFPTPITAFAISKVGICIISRGKVYIENKIKAGRFILIPDLFGIVKIIPLSGQYKLAAVSSRGKCYLCSWKNNQLRITNVELPFFVTSCASVGDKLLMSTKGGTICAYSFTNGRITEYMLRLQVEELLPIETTIATFITTDRSLYQMELGHAPVLLVQKVERLIYGGTRTAVITESGELWYLRFSTELKGARVLHIPIPFAIKSAIIDLQFTTVVSENRKLYVFRNGAEYTSLVNRYVFKKSSLELLFSLGRRSPVLIALPFEVESIAEVQREENEGDNNPENAHTYKKVCNVVVATPNNELYYLNARDNRGKVSVRLDPLLK